MTSSNFVNGFFKFGLSGIYHSFYLFLTGPHYPRVSCWLATIFIVSGLDGTPCLSLSGLHFSQ
jgi:hypothetical protein